jgi:hypothetical protein
MSMRKKFLITFSVCFLLAFAAKAQQPKTPVEMNNYLVGILNSITEKGKAWANLAIQVEESKEFGALTPYRMDIEKLLVAKSFELGQLQDVGGSEDFRKTLISYLKFENDLIQEAFVPYEKLNVNSKNWEVRKVKKNLKKFVKKEAKRYEKIIKAQKDYAKLNDFKLQ